VTATGEAWTTPLLDLLFDDPSVGRCLVAPDGSVLRVNAEWIRSTGLALDDVLGADLVELLPEMHDTARALYARARAGHHVEVPRHPRRVGARQLWWEGSIDPVPMDGGTGLLVTARTVPPEGAAPPEGLPIQVARVIARMRDIADHAPAGVYVKDASGRFLFVNRWLTELHGVPRAGFVGRTAADLLPAPLALGIAEHDRRAAAGQEVAAEETIPTAHGDRVLMTVRFPFPLGGEDVGTFAIAIDVTETRRAEAELREREERFRVLSQAMPQIVCVLAPDGYPEYVNPGWVAFSGLDLASTQRAGWTACVHPEDLEVVRVALRRALKERVQQEVALRYRGADGSYRWFQSRLVPIVDGDRVVRLVGAAMEIEALKQAEAALREQLALKDQLAKVAASVPGVVCSFRLLPGGKACMPFSAPGIVDLYGFSQDVLARDMAPAFARVHREDLQRVTDELATSARDMRPWRAEFRYDHPTKGQRWVVGTSIPAREPDGSILWHGYVADATERKLAEQALRDANERLREADRRKDEFLGMLSHELRNPLAPIRSSVYVLRHAGAAEVGAALEVIERQVDHLTRLVDDLLDVTRIARGKIQLRRGRLDLRDVASRAAQDFRGALEGRGVVFRVTLPEAPVWVHADATRIAQVLGNLLHNASKFTRRSDEVRLELEAAGDTARLRVADTGAGIDPALLPTIFEPFVQADRTLARTEGGLGLGLALVKGIVELHGGSVRAESGGRGKGTAFTVELPLAAPDVQSGAASGEAGRRAATRRVLVVDDNRDAADSLAQLVAVLGHEAEVAYDGEAALALVRARPPDVVLCDIGLPGMDGYELARRIRASSGAQLRLIAVSGYAQPDDVAQAMAAGYDAHVAKPADPERIAALLERGGE
jgi:PAS domain S-box-containing protein